MRITAVPTTRRRGLRGGTALATAATLTAVAASLATSSPPAQAALTHRPGATTPEAISNDSELLGVSAVSATDAWAAGDYTNSSFAGEPLIVHWNGTAWTKVTSPAPTGATSTTLNAVSADSATDAWAAGSYVSSSGGGPLLLRWNGTAWKVVASPASSGDLQGVSAVSATDAWAAGQYTNSSGMVVPLILHWNGTVWTKVTSPVPSGAQTTSLYGVSAVSATDAWAAGYYTNNSGVTVPLILHWNGTAWKKVASPVPSGAQSAELQGGVSAVSATDAWAAGDYSGSSRGGFPLTLRWNGTAWKVVTSPAPSGALLTVLQGVSAVSATDAWAAGWYRISGGVTKSLLLHWNGTAWKQVTSPVPSGAQSAGLSGVSAVSATDAWAAGSSTNSSNVTETLTLHWNGTAWKKVTSPNGP